ncbi:MAG: Lar family restriction alleviation protein [Chitinispirillales bacterium]|nr:Lar family restriction alleviation protein [Chitinispirillales bacterium]
MYYIYCPSCKIETPPYRTEQEAIHAWNRRPDPKTNFDIFK